MFAPVLVSFSLRTRLKEELPAKKEKESEEDGWSQVEQVLVRGAPKD